MKKLFGVTTLVLALSITFSLVIAGNSERKTEDSLPQTPPPQAVAYVFPNGGVQVFEGNLYPYFKSGAQIEIFKVFQSPNGWMLRRRGMENGHSRTEHIPLAFHPGTNYLKIPPVFWLTVCELGCLGCKPNQQNNACDCPSGGDCTFGMLSGEGVQILN